MEKFQKDKIDQIINTRRDANRFYNEHSEVYRAFVNMEQLAFADGSLAKKYKELIALGISIRINCESCIEWHIGQAIKAGATREQILETIGVGIEMGGGPATVSSRFAMRVLDYYSESIDEG